MFPERLPFLIITLCLAAAAPLAGQQPPPADTFPPSFEVVTRLRLQADSAAAAQTAVTRLAGTGPLAAELRDNAQREAELRALLAALLDTDFARPERVSRIGDQAIIEDQRIEAVQVRIAERLDQLAALRARWFESHRFWRGWREALRADPDFTLIDAELRQGVERSQQVLDDIATATTAHLELQQHASELRASAVDIGARVAGLRAERRRALLLRTEPVLFSATHRQQIATFDWRPARDITVTRAPAYAAFFREHTGMLLLHAVLLVLIALFARRVHASAPARAAWSGLLERPWTLAVFASALLALQRVSLAPPLWDVFLWAVLGISGALLATRLFVAPALRRAVYFLAGFYPAFLLLEVARLPSAVFRIITVAAAAVALVIFVLAARRSPSGRAAADLAEDVQRTWPLRLAAAVWAVVLLAAALGFDALARWITHATVTSAAVVFVVVLLVALLRGALASLVHYEAGDRRRTLRRIGLPLVQRLMVLLQIVIITAAALVLLDVWELAPTPLATWQHIVGFGVTVGPVHLTVGRILLGILVIYIAVLVSWLVRTLVESEFYRQWDLDRGVGNTINTLVHYSLITLGVLFALASLGVELQNFAIVAGALGIGIGFGLQNIVNNFVSGLILLFERPVRVGDTVIVGGEWGTITRIGLRSTIMLTHDQSEMIVPNADLISEKVTNWTLSNPIARVIMPIGVAYGSNIGQVLEILREAGVAHAAVLADPRPQALFVGFGDSSLDFELRVWVTEIRLRLEVRSTVLTEVERRLADAGIEIPFPQRDLHVRSVDAAAAELLRPLDR
jgi:potassium-dependent mechanosensitive channel